MLQVEPVDLNITFPSDWITMVAMQPHIHLTDIEPFKWPDGEKERQIVGIKRTLQIAIEKQAHFTLFPEYSIPGLEGINAINDIVANSAWPNKTIIMGGVDGLNKTEYEQLCQQPNTSYHDQNKPGCVGPNEWVNCSITWVKNNDGELNKYIQLKISPAWPEKNISCTDMFCGEAVNIYKAEYENNFPFLFVSFICMDWVGKIKDSADMVIAKFLQLTNDVYKGQPQHLHWIFVLQENPEPNNDLFIQETSNFLTKRATYPMVETSNSAVIFINNSGKTWRKNISANRAFTSCVFPETVSIDTKGCPKTISFASEIFRGKKINRCRDAIFREQRPSIHTFDARVSQFLDVTQESRCHPIENASVYALDIDLDDPRFPGEPVPASVKWFNDKLDNVQSLGNRHSTTLQSAATLLHINILPILRTLPASKQQNNIHYATAYHNNIENWTNVDYWNQNESDSLEYLLHAVTICGIADNSIDFINSGLHARIIIDTKPYEIIAIKGQGHDDCAKYFENACYIKTNHPILLISRDIDNTLYNKRFTQKITKGDSTNDKFTDIPIVQNGYQELLAIYLNSQNEQDLRRGLVRYVA